MRCKIFELSVNRVFLIFGPDTRFLVSFVSPFHSSLIFLQVTRYLRNLEQLDQAFVLI